MLDIKVIRDNPDAVRRASEVKNIACDVDALLATDDRRRAIQQELDGQRHRQKELGGQIAQFKNPKSKGYQRAVDEGMAPEQIAASCDKMLADSNAVKARIKELEVEDQQVQADFERRMLTMPQPPAPEVPVGRDDTENVELRKVGEPRRFDFEPKDHVALGTALGIIDIEGGVKLAGSRNYLLKGAGAMLHQAVLRLAVQMMVERGFELMSVPVLVRDAMMVGTGYFPGGEEQAYRCERDEMSLVGTAEVPLTAYHGDEILDAGSLPRKYVAMSTCFRREAGAAGKDTHGLYRIHAFDKVEQVVIGPNDESSSIALHEEILRNAEDLMQKLELPYRVVNVCTGDLGQGQVQKFDIETWMPSRGTYGETHSASRFYEFQARRLNMRYRDGDKKTRYCHTLNNTVIASPRALIPILELNQNADGSVTIPAVLRPLMGGRERIEAP
jgi:seryl-tRNA synthetase